MMPVRDLIAAWELSSGGTVATVLAFATFVAVVIWACGRPKEQIEADSRLWMDDEK
jgi:hypothetical protein